MPISTPEVRRKPLFFGAPPETLFGWYHYTGESVQSDCVALICCPIGYEYIHSHRSVRHLTDQLAQRGIPAVRFDYSGVGDSTGTDLDPMRVEHWLASIKAAMSQALQISGRMRICLIGINLGATLAAMVASQSHVDILVLWNPAISGRRYLREIQAIAMSAGEGAASEDGTLESAGFVMSAETMDAIRKINLAELDLKSRSGILIVSRDDLEADRSFLESLTGRGVAYDHVEAAGYLAMMAEPQFTIIPMLAIGMIADWINARTHRQESTAVQIREGAWRSTFAFSGIHGRSAQLEEMCHRFGAGANLFGVLSRPLVNATPLPAIVFFNAGCVHHVGPNRLYVQLSRSLAAKGFPCFRFDLAGIGDSIVSDSRIENHPYPSTAPADARAAIETLRNDFGYSQFILLGLCSGAHAAFHAGLDLSEFTIPQIILLNPLTFHWVEGMSLATTRRFTDMTHYKGSLRNAASWLKLLRGRANIGRILGVIKSFLATAFGSVRNTLVDTFLPSSRTRLAVELRKIADMGRVLTFYISEGDPGRDILMAEAARPAKKALRQGAMSIRMISGADHTFTRAQSRGQLLDLLATELTRRYQAK